MHWWGNKITALTLSHLHCKSWYNCFLIPTLWILCLKATLGYLFHFIYWLFFSTTCQRYWQGNGLCCVRSLGASCEAGLWLRFFSEEQQKTRRQQLGGSRLITTMCGSWNKDSGLKKNSWRLFEKRQLHANTRAKKKTLVGHHLNGSNI